MKLEHYQTHDLVQVSQLASIFVENVSPEDSVWTKVLSMEEEENHGRKRHRINISMTHVDQDNRRDLDA